MNAETVVLAIILLACLLYLGRFIRRAFRSGGCGCGSASCPTKGRATAQKVTFHPPRRD